MRSQPTTFITASILLSLTFVPGQAAAQKKPELTTERPKIFDDLISCRSINDIEERVACYDDKVDILDKAEADNELIIADKEEINKAKKGLFGFNLPKIKLFGSNDDKDAEPEVKEVQSIVVTARQYRRGRWRVRLENGSVWEQKETRTLSSKPKKGAKVIVKRASLGSFLVKIGNNGFVRMRRVE